MQRNSKQEDNAIIQQGQTPKDWSEQVMAHKDLDAHSRRQRLPKRAVDLQKCPIL